MLAQLNEQLYLDNVTEKVVTRLELIQQLEEISKLSEEIEGNYFGAFKVADKIRNMAPPIKKILNICRKIFCQNAEQEKQFLVFIFINLRNFNEAQVLSKFDENGCADIPIIVLNGVKFILSKSINELKIMNATMDD